jgi:hypothetical protein
MMVMKMELSFKQGFIVFRVGDGIYAANVKKCPLRIKQLLNDEKLYQHYWNNIISKNLENGSAKAAEYIYNF